jgi:hypothetical protein
MNENAEHRPDPPAPDDTATHGQFAHADDYGNPTTHQMRIIGRRRTDAEAKLEQRQREARTKPPG